MSLQSFPIVGLTKGLQTNVKPAMLPDQAWALLENAYTYRERELKREGRKLLGRLSRTFSSVFVGITTGATQTINLLTISGFISNISQAVNAVVTITTNENLINGDTVIFSQVLGMTQINGLQGTVTVIDSTHFSVNIDSSGFSAYTSGGFFFSNHSLSAIEPQAELSMGSLILTIIDTPDVVFTDIDGVLTSISPGNSGYINYITGNLTFTTTAPISSIIMATFSYFPTLPVMGIPQRDIAAINAEQTIWFDTEYAYIWSGSNFVEFIPGTTWADTNFNLFWAFNYRGTSPSDRLLFVTNDVNTAANPIRYTDGITWTDFAPLTTASTTLFQCLIIIAYYGRLLALNTWEGTTGGGVAGANNFFNRCRFSQYAASPVDADAWRTDIFGRGGAIDAPTNESIIGATFIKNTLVVDFERSTWQLRYVGEYGLPFIWERISADFGSESTFSGVLFDNHRLSVGDKAINAATGIGVDRIDLNIPDQVFSFKNSNNGTQRVSGIRDYKRELVFWNYPDASTQASPTQDLIFPNKVLLYNYRNQTWAIFRDSITCFGTFQSNSNTTWDSLSVFWDSTTTLWDDPDNQSLFPIIVCGNQQGYVSCYGYDSPSNLSLVNANDQETLTIQNVTMNGDYLVITSVNHNLQPDEFVYLTNLTFLNNTTHLSVPTSLDGSIFIVSMQAFNTKDTFSILKWDVASQSPQKGFAFTPILSGVTYVGGGQITLFPRLNILSKDINIYQGKSLQTKLSRLDFLFQSEEDGQVTIKLYLNSSADGSTPGGVGENNLVWKGPLSIDAKPPFYTKGSDYSWFRFYATLSAQYFSINITYSNDQMNDFATHSDSCTLYGINAWCRAGGKNVF